MVPKNADFGRPCYSIEFVQILAHLFLLARVSHSVGGQGPGDSGIVLGRE